MDNWQDWVAGVLALWSARYVFRDIIKPFVTQTCGGCTGQCDQPQPVRQKLMAIES